MQAQRVLGILEFVFGWLAIVAGVAVAAFIYLGGYIEPESVSVDLGVFGVVLLALAVGITVDVVAGSWFARALIWVATFALLIIGVISFIVLLLGVAMLAVVASALALGHAFDRPIPIRQAV